MRKSNVVRHIRKTKRGRTIVKRHVRRLKKNRSSDWDDKIKAQDEYLEKTSTNPYFERLRGEKARKKREEELEQLEWEREEEKENEKRRKYGLPDLDEEGWLSDGSSSIEKEKDGLAIIRHRDSASPASEHPITYDIRDDNGKVLWKSGITYMEEFISPYEREPGDKRTYTEIERDVEKEHPKKMAEEKFNELLKQRKKGK